MYANPRDRELLELAAKAATYELDGMFTAKNPEDMLMLNEKGGHSVWNPLAYDGDALRLAVRLSLTIYQWPDEVCVCNEKCTINEDIARVGDIFAARRRAIVRAAAEIGKAMK